MTFNTDVLRAWTKDATGRPLQPQQRMLLEDAADEIDRLHAEKARLRADIETIIDWWRSANEAPGGCSFMEAIVGMRESVFRLYEALEAQT